MIERMKKGILTVEMCGPDLSQYRLRHELVEVTAAITKGIGGGGCNDGLYIFKWRWDASD